MRRGIVPLVLVAMLVSGCAGGAAPPAGQPASAAKPAAGGKPTTVADLALYQGADRQQILEDGAKQEGQVTLYTSNSGIETVAKEFEKKYPSIKVDVLRIMDTEMGKRIQGEYDAGKVQIDTWETSGTGVANLEPLGFFQPYWSPELAAYGDQYLDKNDKGQVFAVGDRENYSSLAWNTNLISSDEAPKTLDDLLDPKWKGKMATVSSSTGINWIGEINELRGPDFVKKLAQQQIRILGMTAAALSDLVVSGEVPMSPTIGYANVYLAKKKGAPVEWRPLEPVDTTVGFSGMVTKAPHPRAALLLLDFLHSKQGQDLAIQLAQLSSPRTDETALGLPEFKKTILSQQYKQDELANKFTQWEGLFKQSFITGN